MKFWKIAISAISLSLMLGGCFPNPPTPTPIPAPTRTPAPTPTLHPCASAQIATPAGTKDRENAKSYEVTSEVTVSWVPSDCIMTVQSYQNNQLLQPEHKEVKSGTTLKIGAPGSGQTEIKIWWKEYSQSLWVSIK